MIAELVLIVIYLGLEIFLRYRTYCSFIETEQGIKQNQYEVILFCEIGNLFTIYRFGPITNRSGS